MSWNGSDGKQVTKVERQTKGISVSHILIPTVVLVVLGVVFSLFFFKTEPSQSSSVEKPMPQISAVKHKPLPTPMRRKVEKTGDKLKDALAEVEAASELIKISAPPKTKPEPTNSRANRFYKNGVEQLLNWVAATEPGDMPMPMPSIRKEDLADLVNILSVPCSIREDDEEDVKYVKGMVNYGKKEMAGFVADGGTPDQFFDYYFEQLKLAFDTRSEAQVAYGQMREEDPGLAIEYRKKVNEKLAEKGIKPIEPDEDLEPDEYAALHPEESHQ